MEAFNQYIESKSIAVVGPASYVTKFKNKELIESYDLVMRFNAALPVHGDMIDYIGNRTDILCNGLDGNPVSCGAYDSRNWKRCGVKWVFCPYYPKLDFQKKCAENFLKHNNNILDTHFTDFSSFDIVNSKMKTRPNTGLLGIMYLLNNHVKDIYLTGFSFGVGGYTHHKGYKDSLKGNRESNLHNQAEQFSYFKEQFLIHKENIKVDSHLNDILTTC